MKKKLAIMLITAMTTVSLSACSVAKNLMSNYLPGDEESEEVTAEIPDETEESTEEESSEEESSEEKVFSSGASFGTEFDETDFNYEYLYSETLMTDSKENPDTGKMESQKLQIMIPRGDYNTVNRDYAYGEKLGVRVRVELDPYIQYHQEDYTLKENLQKYLDGQYDQFSSVDYKQVTISDIEGDENMVTATVDYLKYDKYDDEYIVYQVVYQFYDFGSDKLALVIVTIDADDTTGKTPSLLAEVNDFYGTDIEWDADAAEAKKEAFLNSNDGDIVQVSTGWIIFDLPKGWSKDWKNNNDYSRDMYAPDGNMVKSGCYISVGRDYQGYGNDMDISTIAGNEKALDALKKSLAASVGVDENDFTISDYGMTVLGQTIEFSYTIVIEDISYEEHCWLASDKSYLYMIVAGQIGDGTEDAIAIAQDILENGRVKGAEM